MTIPIEQAQRDLAKLLEQVAAGEEMVITSNGLPIARVVSLAGGPGPTNGTLKPVAKPDRQLGWGKDMIISISPDFDEPLDDFREYME